MVNQFLNCLTKTNKDKQGHRGAWSFVNHIYFDNCTLYLA